MRSNERAGGGGWQARDGGAAPGAVDAAANAEHPREAGGQGTGDEAHTV